MKGLLKKVEFKDILQGVLAVILILYVVNFFHTYNAYENMKKDLVRRDLIMLGTIVDKYPEAKSLMLDCLNNKGNAMNYEYGKLIIDKIDYYDEGTSKFMPSVKAFYEKERNFTFMSTFGCLLIVSFILATTFSSIYKRINLISTGTEKIMREDFSFRISDEGEGEISKLNYQFNQMANRLEYTIDQLNLEKDYLKDITSDISHQLKTPLASIKMFNEFLIDGVDEKSEEKFLKEMYNQIEKMEWLIKGVLKISRLKSGVIPFNFKVDNLNKTIEETIDLLKDKYFEKKQKVIFNKASEEMLFLHDKAWLTEGLKNIIENAIEYSSDDSVIQINLSDMESHIKIEIIDNGIGIPKEELPHIFDRFYSGNNNERVQKKGTGVGLSLTKLIIQKHNGSITASSKINKGTVFTITFLKQ